MSESIDSRPPSLSFGAQQMLAEARRWRGARDDSLSLADWVSGLLEHHGDACEGGDVEVDAARARLLATGGELDRMVSRDEVAAWAAVHARERGREVVAPADVAAAVLRRATEGRRESSRAEGDEGAQGTGRSRTFRLFVSSTFQDLTTERNALHAYVFPRLRELCRRRGCGFQPIDLRWGVSGEATLDQQTMNICLREIERCHEVTPRPNFLVLLGDRYGWRPLPPQIPAAEFEQLLARVPVGERDLLLWDEVQPEGRKGWYRLDENAVPPEYRLRPRHVDLARCETREDEEAAREAEAERWAEIEKRLHASLRNAASRAALSERERFKYEASATEQEIAVGALEVDDPADEVFCFFRTIRDLPEDASGYLDAGDGGHADLAAREALESLKARLRRKLPECVHVHEARWTEAGPTTDHVGSLPDDLDACLALLDAADAPDTLCVQVWLRLARTILDELDRPTETPVAPEERHIRPERWLDGEGRAHCDFGNRLLRHFVGRDDPREAIRRYVSDPGSRICGVVARGGAGKSALMARALQEAKGSHGDAEIVYRFIGATPASSDGRTLLAGVCREIGRRYGVEEEVSYDFNELGRELKRRLALATAERPLILFLDALDQLSDAHGARHLSWLPGGAQLPAHARIVVSTRREPDDDPGEGSARAPREAWDSLRQKQLLEVPLEPMRRGEGIELLRRWLGDVGRTLTEEQLDEVTAGFARSGGLPLYLRLAFEEARLWRSWDRPEEMAPAAWADEGVLATGIEGIIEHDLFRRLARSENHGREIVSRTLGYLAASRHGLAEGELLDLLSRDADLYASFLRASYHLPPDLLARTAEVLRGRTRSGTGDATPLESSDMKAAERRLQELRAVRVRGRGSPESAAGKGRPAHLTGSADADPLATFLQDVLQRGVRLPVVLWSRLYNDLEPYLTERQTESVSLLDFYHRELGDVASSLYLGEGRREELHGRLAEYFRGRADPDGSGTWAGHDVRGLSELPYHLTGAARWDEVYETLTDFRFLEHKAAEVGVIEPPDGEKVHTGVFALQEDYDRVLAKTPDGDEVGTRHHPLIVTATDFGEGLVVRCPWCNVEHPLPDDPEGREMWLGREVRCPSEACRGPLKVNPFVCERPSRAGAAEPGRA